MANIVEDMNVSRLIQANATLVYTYEVTQSNYKTGVLQILEYLSPSISVVIGPAGLVFNVVNSKVFLKQGVKDCVTICLISLALTDNGSLLCGLLAASSRIFRAVAESEEFKIFLDPMSLWLVLVQAQFCFYDMSTYTTVFIGIERCLCVLLPFKFKSIFTVRNSLFIILSLYVCTFMLHLFLFVYTEFRTVYNPRLNITQSLIYYGPVRSILERYIQLINHLLLPCVSLLIILITTVAMIHGLQKSNHFRNKNAAYTSETKPSQPEDFEREVSYFSENSKARDRKSLTIKLTNAQREMRDRPKKYYSEISVRTIRVAKMVYTLAIMCFVCNSFRFAVMTCFYVDQEMNARKTKAVAFNIVSGLAFLVQTLNCSVNILVYLACNHSYRQTFLSLFGFQCRPKP
ncbi:chemosensory receptor C [Biomphalaria pfeifferi]|uniref:Chemosensory receptor C n=1 Tax=Biomphalaria pfeifferi TaxID=112525 RepID=A0AAD8B7G8_BIOPF|nr:chemosensory receptor C [Biomphalaria pfeifferi]